MVQNSHICILSSDFIIICFSNTTAIKSIHGLDKSVETIFYNLVLETKQQLHKRLYQHRRATLSQQFISSLKPLATLLMTMRIETRLKKAVFVKKQRWWPQIQSFPCVQAFYDPSPEDTVMGLRHRPEQNSKYCVSSYL